MKWRLVIFLFFVSFLAAIIIVRLFYIQVVNRKFYQAQALGQQAGFKEVTGKRGEVFSQNSSESKGNFGSGPIKSLAVSYDKRLVWAAPKEIDDRNHFANVLSRVIGEPEKNIMAKLKESDSYVVLKKDFPAKDISKLGKLDLAGLHLESIPARSYPQGELAAHEIGFLGGDGIGQYGVEGYYDDVLKGVKGIKEKGRGLEIIGGPDDISYLDGSDLHLTIDYNIQSEAESLLKEAKKNIGIDSGQIIVLKPDSGRILAMANFPFFNPNEYVKENNFEIFQNSAVQKIFEPGSVFKPFAMAIALNEGIVSPETKFNDTGSVKIGPNTVYNFDRKVYGQQDMSGILEKSVNTGAVFLSQLIGRQKFLYYLNKIGFNEKTGVDLQGEVYSKNEVLKNGPDFGFATASFGQGIEMTPLQLARAFSAFANDGKIAKPYLVDKIVHRGEERQIKPLVSDPVISSKTVSEVSVMLVNVVERGFGKSAKVPGYYLAGKTGTAQVPLKDGKGYYPNKTVQSFVGFGPALKPQFLILVKLDNPRVAASALSAAPIFKNLAQYIINYWQIPPDY